MLVPWRVVCLPRGRQCYDLIVLVEEDALTQENRKLASQYGRYGYRRTARSPMPWGLEPVFWARLFKTAAAPPHHKVVLRLVYLAIKIGRLRWRRACANPAAT